ncbi:MAG: BspA family leucine-rich repeat surface protein [Lachnospiraceae bacterium]|nr:BspA family leucine-rich repeat surface protein [Lachnospiraceae bacterium]
MRKLVKYFVLCALTICMALWIGGMEASAAITTGQVGNSKGVTWTYDDTTKTLTVSGSDVNLGYFYNGAGFQPSAFDGMFNDMEKLILKDFNPQGSLDELFAGKGQLKTVETVNVDFSKVTTISEMFRDCNNLSSIDLSEFNTSQVTTMIKMFQNCTSLVTLDLTGMDTSSITHINDMFHGCSGLREIEFGDFDTSKVLNYGFMFNGCSSLEVLDISSFDMSLASYGGVMSMFDGCYNLKTLHTPKTMPEGMSIPLSRSLKDPEDGKEVSALTLSVCDKILGEQPQIVFAITSHPSNREVATGGNAVFSVKATGDGLTYQWQVKATGSQQWTNYSASGATTNSITVTATADLNGAQYRCIVKDGSGNSLTSNVATLTVTSAQTITGQVGASKGVTWTYDNSTKTMIITGSDSGLGSEAAATGVFDSICTDAEKIILQNFKPVGCIHNLFKGKSRLKSVETVNFDSSAVTDMSCLFQECTSLTTLDLSGFNAPNVTTMSNMFYGCIALTALDLSGLNTSNLAYIDNMFFGCRSLNKVTFGNFNTSKVLNAGSMFYGCSALKELDLSGFDTARVRDMSNMFNGCNSLEVLNISSFNLQNLTHYGNMFSGCSSLKTLHTPQYMIDSQSIPLGVTLKTAQGAEVSALNAGVCDMILGEQSGNGLNITIQPSDWTVPEGYYATFTVVAEGSNLSYRWQVKAAGESDWKDSDLSGADTASLSVYGTADRDGEQYRCVISDGNGNTATSNAATLSVTIKLSIKTHPQSQTISEGENAVFTVRAVGNGLTYQWQFRNAGESEWKDSTIEGANTTTLTVPCQSSMNGRQYRCSVFDVNGKRANSAVATLTVNAKTAITAHPANQSVDEGANAVFKVTATGSNLSYQWQFKAAGAGEWKDSGMTGAKTSSITVQGTVARNGQQYRCVITDDKGNKLPSNAGTLTVISRVSITTHPVSQSVSVGNSAVFTVTAKGSALRYQWQFKTASASEWVDSGMTGAKTNSITVQGTKARNGYQYRCVVTNGSGGKAISNGATLIVNTGLTIASHPVSVSVSEGSNATFKVKASGDGLKYQWQFRKSDADSWINSGMTGSNTDSITVQGTAARNGYQYRCVITDGSGNKVTSNGATLTVNSGVIITAQPENQSVREGTNATFSVTATGSKLSYQWQFRKSDTDSWKNSGMTGSNTNNITVQGTAARNGYQYRCVVTDGNGKKLTSNGATLTVTPALVITGQPASQSVSVGSYAAFSVTVEGTAFTYQWQVKTVGASDWANSGMTGAQTNRIIVQGTAARNGYQYRCIITDGNGNKVTSNGVTLTVK